MSNNNKKPHRKVVTEDKYIDAAEEKLGIKYPPVIRNKLKEQNGFYWGFFDKFYPVRDEEDVYHTANDVVREYEKGMGQFIPKEFVPIAEDSGGYCLALKNDGTLTVYFFGDDKDNPEVFAETDEELEKKLNEQESELDYY